MNKNCPMPDNWKERKAQMSVEVLRDPESRGKVYKELFETGSTEYRNVSDFLTEFVAHVFPKDFMGGGGKNRTGVDNMALRKMMKKQQLKEKLNSRT